MKNQNLKEVFQNVIEEQLLSGSPHYVGTTLKRLVAEGYSIEEAKAMMAGIIAYHMSNIIDNNNPFDGDEYQRLLDQLPQFPDAS